MASDPDILEQRYPSSCPFCTIAQAHPFPSEPIPICNLESAQSRLNSVPCHVDINAVQPSCSLVLSSPHVLAFLDIMPMTRGHLLVASRNHREKIGDVSDEEGKEFGFWLPILARVVASVTGCADYNIVQNNGARAAQVVPHVHFHIIPRPSNMRELRSQSWTMFGRGQREELDDEEGEALAAEMREELRGELRGMETSRSKI